MFIFIMWLSIFHYTRAIIIGNKNMPCDSTRMKCFLIIKIGQSSTKEKTSDKTKTRKAELKETLVGLE